MLTRTQKEEQVVELNEKFSRAKSVYVADYRGLNVAETDNLRQQIRKGGAGDFEYRVAKNSVLRRASADLDVAGLGDHFEGPTAVAISFGDPVGLAKILSDFAKDHEVFELKGGVVEGAAKGVSDLLVMALGANLQVELGYGVGDHLQKLSRRRVKKLDDHFVFDPQTLDLCKQLP